MNCNELLIKKYKEKVIPKEKNVQDMINFLSHRFDVKQVSLQILSPTYLYYIKKNAQQCSQEKGKKLEIEELDFIAYEVIENDKSEEYYKEVDPVTDDSSVIILIEKNTKYSQVNNRRLQTEILIEWGISQFDYDNNTEEFASYLSRLERLENDY